MRRDKSLHGKIPPALLRDWRGHPLYIITTYLRGQLTLTLPSFLIAMIFTRIIVRVIRYDLSSLVTIVVCLVTAMAYIFYHYYSPNIRVFPGLPDRRQPAQPGTGYPNLDRNSQLSSPGGGLDDDGRCPVLRHAGDFLLPDHRV